MILFYDKTKNNKIFNVNYERIYSAEMIEKFWVQPGHLTKEQVGKYIVEFKNIYKEEKRPITRLQITDRVKGIVEKVKIGEEKVKVPAGMKPNVPFSDLILEFEERKKNPFDYRLVIRRGKVVDIKRV